MSCCTMSCMSCCFMICHVMSRDVISCNFVLYTYQFMYVVSCHVMPRRVTLYNVMPCSLVLYQVIYVVSCHAMSHNVLSCNQGWSQVIHVL